MKVGFYLACRFSTFAFRFDSPLRKSIQKHFSTRMSTKYPDAKREDVVDTYHGVEITDPYRWLEDPNSDQTKNFVAGQNALTLPYIHTYPFREQINESVTELWDFPKYSPPFKQGDVYFQYRNTGLQNQSVLYKMETLEREGNVFLDPNLLSNDGTVALAGISFTENGKVMAYGLSRSGSDWIEIKFKNVETGDDYDDVLKKVKFSTMTWMHDHETFFYCAYLDRTAKSDGSETETNEYQKLYMHKLGTQQTKDIVVAEFDDPEFIIGASVSECGNYIVVTTTKGCKNNLVYYSALSKTINKKFVLIPIVTELDSDYQCITNNGSKFFFYTNKDAQNYQIITIDFENPKSSNWKTLIPEHEKDVLSWGRAINNDYLLLCYLRDVKNTLSLHKLATGEKIMDLPLQLGTVSGMSGKREHNEMFYSFVSFLTPNITYKVNFNGEEVKQTVFHETKVGSLDTSQYVSKQEFYISKDGTKVPMFIVHKHDFVQDGKQPCILYGYGGFNISVTPAFSVSRLVFLNHFGGCFAVANIRGGGEYGDKWHDGGRFGNKQNCFDDFQWAAKHLIKHNYTNSSKLSIIGGSNGGLLVAACINQAPELFSAAICQVGVMDMLRFHKFTIGYAWKSDYGSSETNEGFEHLYKYSPLHNIKEPPGDVQYPATLLLTADHDDRVVPLHSLKYIAQLQHTVGSLPKQLNPLMIRVEMRAGHGAGKPTSKIIEEVCDTLCFIAKSSNLEFNGCKNEKRSTSCAF